MPNGLIVVCTALLFSGTVVPSPPAAAAPPTLTMSPASTTIGVGGTGDMHLEYDADGSGPEHPSYVKETANWSSSNPSVVTVQAGNLTAVGAGTAVVTGRFLGLSATGTVTVSGTTVNGQLRTPDNRNRTYRLYVPSGYTGSAAVPLVLNFHGGVGTKEQQETVSRMNRRADAETFIVAYPQGVGTDTGTWNGGSCCGGAVTFGVDDVTFTELLLDHLSSSYNVDADRVYAAGLSNGAIFAHRLGCELSDRIAAIAAVAGGLNTGGDFPSCAPPRAVPVLAFHGTTDDRYPYNGGMGSLSYGNTFNSIPATLATWRQIDGLSSASPTVVLQQGIETCTRWSNASGMEVELCLADPDPVDKDALNSYDGGGHAWPGGVRWATGDVPTQDVDATARMWDFFSRHPMP